MSQQERRHQPPEDPEACQRLRQKVQPPEKENLPKNFLETQIASNSFSSTASVNYFCSVVFKILFFEDEDEKMPRQLLTL